MKWLPPIFALLAGLLGGYFLSGTRVPESQASTAASLTSTQSGVTSETVTAMGAEGEPGEKLELTKAETKAVAEYGVTEEWLKSLESMNQLDQLSALLPRLKAARPEDFATLMEALDKYAGSMKWMTRNILISRWAASDPAGMMAYIESQPVNEQYRLRNSFFSAWAREEPEAAFAKAKRLQDRREKQSAIQGIVNAISGEQPYRAIEMLKELEGTGYQTEWTYRNIFRNWAQREPEAARQAALGLDDGPAKVRALSGAMDEWMHRDPMAALSWLDSLPMDGTVYNSRREVFQNLLNQDFDTAKEYIERETDPLARRNVLSNLHFGNFAWRMDFDEMKSVFDWVGTVATGSLYDQKVGDFVRSLSDKDPQKAIEFALQLPPGNGRMNAIGNLGSHLAQRNPEAALQFVAGLDFEDEKRRALQSMGWQIARYGVEAASRFVAASEDPMVREQLVGNISREWSKYNREAALDWAESLEDEGDRSLALRPVFDNWIQSDPQAAMAYLKTSVPEGKHLEYLQNAFGQWTREDPEAAIEWLDRLPETVEGGGVENIYSQVANYYVQHDPMAASEWISTMDEGPVRDRSVETLVRNISRSDPEAGFIWAATITDVDKRKRSLDQSIREWVKTDPDAAYDAVEEARIPAEEKATLFGMIERHQS
ncbi:hypothetical protein [Coraliomargarita parva]|uniref:hypothetical protein n=1 Tax=Coraliomargarita parva TaxID=3014050 RepID=UPI0022B4D02A|nr:hypothetical protein [Coraliomargarita parva]